LTFKPTIRGSAEIYTYTYLSAPPRNPARAVPSAKVQNPALWRLPTGLCLCEVYKVHTDLFYPPTQIIPAEIDTWG